MPSLCAILATTLLAWNGLDTTTGDVSAIGRCGGRLVISQRVEPKTLNPVTAIDGSSRQIIGLINSDLIHINRFTLKTEPALASSWSVSADHKTYTLRLRHGLRFSDGQPFDADDVLFTFQAYLDERLASPQRDLLIIANKPIEVRKLDAYTVQFELARPYAAAERLFDSIAILPRHLLEQAYENGSLAQAWSLTTPATQIAGLGPFQVKTYVPGQRIELDRNPYYWKNDRAGNRLPYLDEIICVFTGNADAEAMRFQRGEIDVVSRLSAANFSALQKYGQTGKFRLYDLGPGLEYAFLVFNLNRLNSNHSASIESRQSWFRQVPFRKAISLGIDRDAIVRLAYYGHASPLATQVTPGNKLWIDRDIPPPKRSVAQARQLLQQAGFSRDTEGRLLDKRRERVTFSISFNAANSQHAEIATLVQQDLDQLGVSVNLVPLEFHALIDRIFKTYDYDAALMALADGDADPNSEMNVWVSGESTHVWNLASKRPQTSWEAEIDSLMQQQLITPDYEKRKRMYDRVQELVWENLPIICLASPDVLAGATERLGNFRPAILGDYALWNVEELFFRR